MARRYLIWLDILGFERLTEEIAEKTQLTARKVRWDFVNLIKEKVEAMETRGEILGKNYGERDDWILVTDSIDLTFKILAQILDHTTEYENYEQIPLEIAIGTGEYDKWAEFDGRKLIVEKPTIAFLKTNIIGYYHKWYRLNHKSKSPTSTFIISTESLYRELEPFDKKICRKVEYRRGKKPIEEVSIFFVADANKIKQRGIMFQFMEKIRHPGSRLYHRIDDLYIFPHEYEEIRNTLETKRVVIITGPPEYGKTYTAIRLLWEYFNKGYEPLWREGGEEWERREARKRLEDIEIDLKPKHIIYFEDPFGKTKYESRDSLEREIGAIIERVNRTDNAYVVITSREEIFKEFEKEHLSSVELEKFEKKLNLRKPSYGYKKRREMLLKWAEAENCEWRQDVILTEVALDLLKDKGNLPTPLTIKDFATSTTTITEADKLREKLREKSKETARNFAEEVKNMADDKILFLLFPFISSFTVSFVKNGYKNIAKELKMESPLDFDIILNWFKHDKIDISTGRIEFSHPSYSEAIKYLLIDKRQPTHICREILVRLLCWLSKKNSWEVIRAVAWAVASHFDNLPEDARNKLLLELSERSGVIAIVASTVENNFINLPEKVRTKLLLKLSQSSSSAAAKSVATAITKNFYALPKKVGVGLLLTLSGNAQTAGVVAGVVRANFDRLPENVRNRLMLKLMKRDEGVVEVARTVGEKFDRLPEKLRSMLLQTLSKKEAATYYVASAIASNFQSAPDGMRNLLFKMVEQAQVTGEIAWAVASHFDNLPEDARNDLLLKLSERDEAVAGVARTVAENFDKLPEEVRKLLFKMAEKPEVVGYIVWAIEPHFDKLPEGIRDKLLLKLKEKAGSSGSVTWFIRANFDRLLRKLERSSASIRV